MSNTCDARHGLAQGTMDEGGHTCDRCEKDIRKGEPVQQCRRCEYDLCMTCAAAPSEPPVPAVEGFSCGAGHGLAQGTMHERGHTCDLCEKDIRKGEPVQQCRRCEYDLCIACASRSKNYGPRKFTFATGIAVRQQWDANHGYCGEVWRTAAAD